MAKVAEEDVVKAADTDAKAPADKKAEEVAKAKAPEAELPMPAPMILAGALVLAVVVAIAQQSDVMNGGSLIGWGNSLFEEHVVPPPIAHEGIVTVQFCQS